MRALRDQKLRRRAIVGQPDGSGRALLERFVLDICGASPDWIMRDHIAEAVARIREQVGDEEVILGLSGGVDSSVAAAVGASPADPAGVADPPPSSTV